MKNILINIKIKIKNNYIIYMKININNLKYINNINYLIK